MSWQNKAKIRMRALKITQNDLMPVMGVTTRGAIGHYLSGRRTPSIDQFKALAERLEMKLDELMSGENTVMDESASYAKNPINRSDINNLVPLIGSVIDVNLENFNAENGAPKIPTSAPVGQRTFALRIDGDSMEPEFLEHDVIIVEPDLAPQNGDYVIAQQNTDTTFKQLCKESGDWYLKPLNDRYPIKPLGNSRIIGVVREKFKRYR